MNIKSILLLSTVFINVINCEYYKQKVTLDDFDIQYYNLNDSKEKSTSFKKSSELNKEVKSSLNQKRNELIEKEENTEKVFERYNENRNNTVGNDNIKNNNKEDINEEEEKIKNNNEQLEEINEEVDNVKSKKNREFCLYNYDGVTKVINPFYTDSNNNTVFFDSIEEYSKFIGPTWLGVSYCGNNTIVNNIGIYYEVAKNSHKNSKENKKEEEGDALNKRSSDENTNNSTGTSLTHTKSKEKEIEDNIIKPSESVLQGVPSVEEYKEIFKEKYENIQKNGLKCIALNSINPGYNPYHPALINFKTTDDIHNIVTVMGIPYGGNRNEYMDVMEKDRNEENDNKRIKHCGIVKNFIDGSISCSVSISKTIDHSVTITDSSGISYHNAYGRVLSEGSSLTEDINNVIELSSALTDSKSISHATSEGDSTALESVYSIVRSQSVADTTSKEKTHTNNHEDSYAHTESEDYSHTRTDGGEHVDTHNWSESKELSHNEEYSRMDMNDYKKTKNIKPDKRSESHYLQSYEMPNKRAILPVIGTIAGIVNSAASTYFQYESNQIAKKGNEISQEANNIAREGNDISRQANDIAAVGNFAAFQANEIASIANAAAFQANDIAREANVAAFQANDIASKANDIAERANDIAVDANRAAYQANDIAKTANYIAQDANKVARDANDIAREANYIATWTAQAELEEAIRSRESQERIAYESSRQELRIAAAGTRSSSDTTSSTKSKESGRSDSTNWSDAYTNTSGTSDTWTNTDGYSDAYTRGHSETSSKELSESDSASRMYTSNFNEEHGWVNESSSTKTSSNSYAYGNSNTRTYNSDISYDEAIDRSAEKSHADAVSISENREESVEINFKIPDTRCWNLTALPLFKSEVNVWACGEYDGNGELLVTYKKSIRPIGLLDFAQTPIACNSNQNMKDYEEYVLNDDKEKFIFIENNKKNTLRSKNYLEVKNAIISESGKYVFGLLESGELVLCEGKALDNKCLNNKLWTNGMDYIPKTNENGVKIDYKFKLYLGSNGHLYVTAKHIFKSYNPNVKYADFSGVINPTSAFVITSKESSSTTTTTTRTTTKATTNKSSSTVSNSKATNEANYDPTLSTERLLPFNDKEDEYIIWDSLPKDLPFNVGFPDGLGYYLYIKDEHNSASVSVCIYDGVGVKIWEIRPGQENYVGYAFPREYNMPLAFDTPRATGEISKHDKHNVLGPKVKDTYKKSIEMNCNNVMKEFEALVSMNGKYKFFVQDTGNMVVKEGARTMWSSMTANIELYEGPYTLNFSPLGEFILRDKNNFAIWHVINPLAQKNKSYKGGNFRLVLSDEGELFVEDDEHNLYWSSWPVRKSEYNTHIRYIRPMVYEISSCNETLRPKYIYNLFSSPELYNYYEDNGTDKSYKNKYYVNNLLPGESLISTFGAMLNVTDTEVIYYYNKNEKHEKISKNIANCKSHNGIKELNLNVQGMKLVCNDNYENRIVQFDTTDPDTGKYARLSIEYRYPMTHPDIMIFNVLTWEPLWASSSVRFLHSLEEMKEPSISNNKIISDKTFSTYDRMFALDGTDDFLYLSNKNGLEFKSGPMRFVRNITMENNSFYINNKVIIQNYPFMKMHYDGKDDKLVITNSNRKTIWELYSNKTCEAISSSDTNCNTIYSQNLMYYNKKKYNDFKYYLNKNMLFFTNSFNETEYYFYNISSYFENTNFNDTVYSISLKENGDITLNDDQYFLHKEFFKPDPPYRLVPEGFKGLGVRG
ncbi:hypothetical protein H8356DRAFT_1036219 [Neocallimastix lanati (nom. inval.)]|nr:hypothetical protein H8356DRAFT_1036219 [Neocallimastix sp. JGI-2020a]